MLTALTDSDWELVRFYLAPLRALMEREQVTNIMVNRYDDIWADDLERGMYRTELRFADDAAVAALIEQIANALQQYFDPVKTPIVNARLPDGSRVCATLPTATPAGCTLSIRLHRRYQLDLEQLARVNTLDAGLATFLSAAVARGDNLLVSGATNSGKTTLLSALSCAIPPSERVVLCEDVAELRLKVANVVRMEAQQRDDGVSEPLSLELLLTTALRQRPDRIIIGEIRAAAAAQVFFQALNTGHRGVSTSIHANGARGAFSRLIALTGGRSELPASLIEAEYLHGLDLFLHMERQRQTGARRLTEVCVVEAGKLRPRFQYDASADDWAECA